MSNRRTKSKPSIAGVFCTMALFFAVPVSAKTLHETQSSISQSKSNHPVVSPLTNSAPLNQTADGNQHEIQLSDSALRHKLFELERTKHELELSSLGEPAGHKAVAARHLQSAINELKLEMKQRAKGKQSGSSRQAIAAAKPGARK